MEAIRAGKSTPDFEDLVPTIPLYPEFLSPGQTPYKTEKT
jgi:hypothetical protein